MPRGSAPRQREYLPERGLVEVSLQPDQKTPRGQQLDATESTTRACPIDRVRDFNDLDEGGRGLPIPSKRNAPILTCSIAEDMNWNARTLGELCIRQLLGFPELQQTPDFVRASAGCRHDQIMRRRRADSRWASSDGYPEKVMSRTCSG